MPLLRQDKLTMDERWIALLNRKPVDRIAVHPLGLGFCAINAGRTIPDFYPDLLAGNIEARDEWMGVNDQYGFDQLYFIFTDSVVEFGGEYKMPSGDWSQSIMVGRLGVNTLEEAWSWKSPPDVTTSAITSASMMASKREVDLGASYLQLVLQGPWDIACRICGIERLCKWTRTEPETAHHLLRLATDYNLQIAKWWVDTFGGEKLFPFSTHAHTAGQIIGPKTFEEFCLPYLKEEHETMIAWGVKHFMTHICGYHAQNYPMWAQIPMGDPGVISVAHDVDADWQTPLESVSKLFPNDILMGNIEPAQFQMGTPAHVYKLARHCIEIGKKHEPGFVLAPGCELPPKCSPYSVWMMSKAVNDFGWYD